MTRCLGAALLALFACEYDGPTRPVLGYEANDRACSDLYDNDFDGLIDCEDADCFFFSGVCGEIIPLSPPDSVEVGLRLCNDSIDNDDDGQFDCGDAECASQPENCCQREFSDALCSDGIDNDGNNSSTARILVAADDDCKRVSVCLGSHDTRFERAAAASSGAAPSEASSQLQSLPEGFDYADLLGTQGDIDGERNDRACSDGLDNDGDGYIDCADLGCRFGPDVAVCREQSDIRFSVVGRVGFIVSDDVRTTSEPGFGDFFRWSDDVDSSAHRG